MMYVGWQACGCPVAVVADLRAVPRKSIADTVAEFICNGYAVTRETLEHYQSTIRLGCTCDAGGSAHKQESEPCRK